MNLKEYFNEEYADTIKVYDRDVNIFSNPSRKEINEAGKIGWVRYIIDNKLKKVYVFNSPGIHNNVFAGLGFKNYLYNSDVIDGSRFLFGLAEKKSGKWIHKESDFYEIEISRSKRSGITSEKAIKILQEVVKQDWSWANKYIDITDFIDEMKNAVTRKGLTEEWIAAGKKKLPNGRNLDVFVNPSKKELNDVSLNRKIPIRFLADSKTKKIYVSTSEVLHFNIALTVGSDLKDYNDLKRFFNGVAYSIGDWVVKHSDLLDQKIHELKKEITEFNTYKAKKLSVELQQILHNTDWSWINKYFKIDKFLKEQREKFDAVNKKLKPFLKEEFVNAGSSMYGGEFEVFVNPSKKELSEISDNNKKEIRFLADSKTKKVYVAHVRVVHNDIAKIAKLEKMFETRFLNGVAEFKSGKWEMVDSDRLEGSMGWIRDNINNLDTVKGYIKKTFNLYYNNLKKWIDTDWSWVDKYISVTDYLNSTKNDLELLLKKTKINEEYVDTVKIDNRSVEVFANPSRKEILDLVKDKLRKHVRYTIDNKKKKVYIFDYEELHDAIYRDVFKTSLGELEYSYEAYYDIHGSATYKAGKLVHEYSDYIAELFDEIENNSKKTRQLKVASLLKKMLDEDWSWANKYVDISSLLSEIRKHYEEFIDKNENVNEEYHDTVKDPFNPKSSIEIFVNPNKKEFEEASKDQSRNLKHVRYLADNRTKKLYIHSPDITHSALLDSLHFDKKYGLDDIPDVVYGEAKKNRGNWVHNYSDQFNMYMSNLKHSRGHRKDDIIYMRNLLKDIAETDWSWVNKYLDITPFIKEINDTLEKIK